jgi:hypothetical protein
LLTKVGPKKVKQPRGGKHCWDVLKDYKKFEPLLEK